ncbi:hypothetical protein M3B46_03170 [Sphingobacterium daejeonense]|uniref:hypothetical protein n=1 Tax=Sphingobacterium daejeonense TaxID=371142 RepID=UPI0021A29D9F|nr:hypothetical protein [Sphingobacterium daejeonense]MCT1529979.1 hypothetical protein [Sphingobacterium daejeonense]
MNELFFSAMFIGSLLFGNPETKEIPSEFNITQTALSQENPTGKISLVSNNGMTYTFKVTGDPIKDHLNIYVNGQLHGSTNVGQEFNVKRPVRTGDENSILVELKHIHQNSENIYASYLISF